MQMTPQERDVITGIFDKLKSASNQPRDPEAEKLIAEKLAAQPYAPYAMAQSVYVQEQALINMQQQVEALQGQMAQLQSQLQAQSAPQQGGFLSGIFGGKPSVPNAGRPGTLPPQQPSQAWQQPAQSPMMGQPMQQAPGPWGGQQPPRQGGGFLQSAMTTAAGVAGGMVLGNVLMNAFSGDKSGAHGNAQPAAASSPAAEEASFPNASEASYASAATGNEMAGPDYNPPAYQPASYDSGNDDFGGGGDGDWA
jgi:uncharacterized protein